MTNKIFMSIYTSREYLDRDIDPYSVLVYVTDVDIDVDFEVPIKMFNRWGVWIVNDKQYAFTETGFEIHIDARIGFENDAEADEFINQCKDHGWKLKS